jgi:hypothetical protein
MTRSIIGGRWLPLSLAVVLAGIPESSQSACAASDRGLTTVQSPIGFARALLREDRRPLVLYTTDVQNASSAHIADCSDLSCSTNASALLDNSTNYYGTPGFVMRPGGLPAVVAPGFAGGGFTFYDCGDAACTFRFARPIPGRGFFNAGPATVLPDGRVVMTYDNGEFGEPDYRDVFLYTCANLACTSGTASKIYDVNTATNENVRDIELATSGDSSVLIAATRNLDGAPSTNAYELSVCPAAGCSGPAHQIVSGPVATSYPIDVAIAMRSNGLPIMLDNQSGRRVLIDCQNAQCTSNVARPLPDNAIGIATGLVVDGLDRPAFGLLQSGAVAFFQCSDVVCGAGQATSVPSPALGYWQSELSRGVDGTLMLSYIDATTRTLRLATCDSDAVFASGFEAS